MFRRPVLISFPPGCLAWDRACACARRGRSQGKGASSRYSPVRQKSPPLQATPKGKQYGELPDIARDGKHFLSAWSHADVFCEIRPTHDTGTIDEEFGRTGDIVAIRSRGGMQKIVTADYVKVGIREKREVVPGLAAQVRGNLGRVDADGDGANAKRLEFLKLLLDASQLEETEGSPVASIEDQQDGFGLGAVCGCRKQLRKGSRLTGAVREGELGEALSYLRRAC